ncbi:STAS domain-containing protein [Vibrio sp. AK197]|uniref:Lipid asymmetry maintenance protein MlaB n=1 Tax=Vibrio olivae TaxID=1243002 RepID=A0ABV5HMQ4_9VIBR
MDCLLNETLDISTVLDSTEHYKQWLADSNQALNLDASDVSRVDAAGIQALASLFLTAEKNQQKVTLNNSPKVLTDGITILGLTTVIDVSQRVDKE